MDRATKRKAQSMVEFAIVVPLFFLLMFAILDFGRLFYTQMTLQNAVREAGRFAVTGRHLADGKGGQLSRVQSILQVVQQSIVGMSLNPTAVQVSSQTGGAGNAGGPSDTMTITVNYQLTLMTPFVAQFFKNGQYLFTVSTTFKNEPFSPDQTM